MEAVLSQRVHELVENGWEPQTTTESLYTINPDILDLVQLFLRNSAKL